MTKYKCAGKRFDSLALAKAHAQKVLNKTGNFVAIEAIKGRAVAKKNPAKKPVTRKSQITGRKPTPRLLERREKPVRKGYFPNPLKFVVQRKLHKAETWETLASFSQQITAMKFAKKVAENKNYMVRVIT